MSTGLFKSILISEVVKSPIDPSEFIWLWRGLYSWDKSPSGLYFLAVSLISI